MHRNTFTMRLKPGTAEEYKRRHDAIWPELVILLKEAGISDYGIFLDETTGTLFAVQKLAEGHTADFLQDHPIMRRWWDHMADLMEVYPDNSPVCTPLREVFYLA